MEIPLFPLPNIVLFPNVVLPLHIFEDRYKLMINTCAEQDEPFGLVLLRSGSDQESEESIHRVGVTARIIQVERLDDGRMNILTEGENRFRVLRFIQETPYWKGSVNFFEDDRVHEPGNALYEEVSDLYRKLYALGTSLSGSQESELAIPESAVELSYMVSYILDIDAEEKQKLLEMTSTADRLQVLAEHLLETIRKVEEQIAYKKVVSKVRGNGDLGHPSV